MKRKIDFNLLYKFFNFKVLMIGLLVLAAIFSYRSDFIMFTGLGKLQGLTKDKLPLISARVKVMKVIEDLSFPNYLSEYYKTPIIDISLNQKDLNLISQPIINALNYEDIYYKFKYMLPIHGNSYSNAAKIDVTYENQSYEAKIKIQGRSEEHFLDLKKSFAIKFSKTKLPDNMREIALIILDEQDISTIFSYYLVKKYLGWNVNSKIVRLRINGVDQGLYLLEEKERKELLEKNKLSGVDIIQPNAMWTTQTQSTHTHQFSHNISSSNFKNYSELNNGQLLKYKKIYSTKDYEIISKLVDIDKFARFEALRMVHGDLHAANGDNLKLFYTNSTGRFSPLYRPESFFGDLEDFVSDKTYLYDSIASEIPVIETLTQNNHFRNLRNKYLYEIIKDREELLDYFSVNLAKYINAVDEDTSNLLSQRDYKYQSESKYKLFDKNLTTIEKYLNYGRVYSLLTAHTPKEYALEVDADSNSFVKIKDIQFFDTESLGYYKNILVSVKNVNTDSTISMKASELEKYFMNERFILGLDENLQSKNNKSTYLLDFENEVEISNFKISYLNEVTGKDILEINNYVKYIEQPQNFSFDFLDLSLVEFLSLNKNFSIINDVITFDEKEHVIKDNLIFPYGYDVKIHKGTSIKLIANSNIVIYGGLEILGTKKNPVVISNLLQNKPFGSILVLGDSKSLVDITGLDLSGGSESLINGVYASGAISIHNHSNVRIHNSYIHHNSADDGMNIKNSNIELIGNIFANNYADQLDIDFSNGLIEKNTFYVDLNQEDSNINILSSDNGDGVDFSGSKIHLKNNFFKGFIDKAVSIGEETTTIVEKNSFKQNRSAITAKDQSNVYLISNEYDSNKVNIEMYQKKIFFDAPVVYSLNENHSKDLVKNNSSQFLFTTPKIDVIENNVNLDLLVTDFKQLNWQSYVFSN